MRVLFVNPGGDAAGGAERSLHLLVRGLVERGHEAGFISLTSGTAATSFEHAGATIIANGMDADFSGSDRHASSLRFALGLAAMAGDVSAMGRGIRAMASNYNADIIHSNGLRSHALTPYLARRCPVVWSLRERPANATARAIVAASSRSASAIAATTRFSGAGVAHCGRPVYVIDDPIDPIAHIERAAARGALSLPLDRQIVAMLAHLHPTKGHHVAIQAWGLLAEPRPLLVLAGGDLYGAASVAYRQDLLTQIDQAGLGNDVVLPGLIDDVPALLSAADLLIHPASHPEGFGRTIAEAQMAGVPVAATNIGGVMELIDDGESGLLFAPDDPAALAEVVDRVLSHPDLAEHLHAGGLRACTRYEPHRHVDTVENIYRMVLRE